MKEFENTFQNSSDIDLYKPEDENDSIQSNNSVNFGQLPPEMRITRPTCLDSKTFRMENIHIVGQFNKQIILVVVPSGDAPILHGFDQHGVHERIRFEEILRTVVELPKRNIRTRQLYPPFEFPCSEETIVEDITLYQEALSSLCSLNLDTRTIRITGQPNEYIIIVRQIPACFTSHYQVTIMKRCIIDAIRYVKKIKNNSTGKEPRRGMFPYLLNHIRSRACHGAIRFGEVLSKQSSRHLIHELSQCQQQFRCAHGRVLAKPLILIPITGRDITAKCQQFDQEFGDIQAKTIQKY